MLRQRNVKHFKGEMLLSPATLSCDNTYTYLSIYPQINIADMIVHRLIDIKQYTNMYRHVVHKTEKQMSLSFHCAIPILELL